MFRPVPMMRFNLVVLKRDERAVLRDLGSSAVVQLVGNSSGPDTAPLDPQDHSPELARCVRLLGRVEQVRRSLQISNSAETPAHPPSMTLDEAESKLGRIEASTGDILERREHLLHQWAGLTADYEQLSCYHGLEIPLCGADRYSFLHFVTGTLPAEKLEWLQSEVPDHVALLPLPEQEGRHRLIAMSTRQDRIALECALQQAGFQHETLPAVEGATTDSLSETRERERQEALAALAQLKQELDVLAQQCARSLADIERIAAVERCLLEVDQGCPRTEAAVLITGWVPADDTARFEKRVKQITGNRCVIDTSLPARLSAPQPPVLLRHTRFLRPFEMLVSAYGLPNYQELEPTLFVAISYILMFGMMFGDTGHGAVLTAVGLIALLAGRTEKKRDFGLLLLFGGLSSVVFGFIYGCCFGLARFKKYALWHDPLEGDPMPLMYGSLGIGIAVISLGLMLNIINRSQRGDVIGGFLDKFGVAGLLFYWGALALIAKFATIQSHGLLSLMAIPCLVLPIAGWALKEPLDYFLHRCQGHPTEPHEGLLTALTESLVGAFEAILSYLANTISFVRLAAYAMSHAALLVAAFILANAVSHFPVGGGLLNVLVIILGNVVAIVLEAIIASVQALRLEYYEFFGKFFSGSGQAFKPFRLAETVGV